MEKYKEYFISAGICVVIGIASLIHSHLTTNLYSGILSVVSGLALIIFATLAILEI